MNSDLTGHQAIRIHSAAYRVPIICVCLVLMVFTVFGPTVRHGFVNYDDDSRVYDNPIVLRGVTWEGVSTYFSVHHPRPDYWHPLTFLTHMMDCQFYGIWAGGHHLTNVLLHSLNAILIFLLLRSMTQATWRSALVAALFAIHPLRVESVAWISARKDMLSGIFFLLTIGAYLRYGRRPSVLGYLGVTALFALGLMSKPTLMPLPILLLAFDYWPLARHQHTGRGLARISAALVLEKIPLLIMSAASCWEASIGNAPAFVSGSSYPLPLRLENAVVSYGVYLWQTLWPSGLCIYYPFPDCGIPFLETFSVTVLLFAISWTVIILRRREPILLLGWIWYLVMLLPMSGIIQAGGIARADRYTYIPMIGIAIMIVWIAADWTRSLRVPRLASGCLAASILAGMMICSIALIPNWHDSRTLWTRALECAPETDLARNSLGNAMMDKGLLNEALEQFQRSISLNPRNDQAHVSLGFLLFKMEKYQEANEQLKDALMINPHNHLAHNDLGNVLFRQGNPEGAISQFQEAIRLNPNYTKAKYNLGDAFFGTGKKEEGIEQYRQALKMDDTYTKAHVKLAEMLQQVGRSDEALQEYRTALAQDSSSEAALTDYARLLAKTGHREDACSVMRRMLRSHPSDWGVCNDLAWILSTAPESNIRNGSEAVELALRAVDNSGGRDPYVLDTLAASYAEKGDYAKAVETARTALKQAEASGKRELSASLQAEISLYQSGKPLRDPR